MLKKRDRDEEGNLSDGLSANNHKKRKIENGDAIEADQDDFKAYGIDDSIAKKLKEKSIVSLFEVQKRVFKPVYNGDNLLVSSLTGSGKTLSFVLPILQKAKDKDRFKHTKPFCLVMAPTRELSIQVGREFSELVTPELNFRAIMVYGGVSIDDQIRKLRNGCDIVIGTPGRVMDMIERKELSLKNLRVTVLDEADKMLSMGFQEQIEDIYKKIYEVRSSVQVCLISATIERWVLNVARTIMKNEDHKFIDLVKELGGRTPKTVQHFAVNCLKSEKVTTMADLILCYGGTSKSTIVFVNTKKECNELMISDKIKQEVQIVHGDINQSQRESTIEGFKKGKFRCLVATDVASRGLDIPMVDLVIQSEPPKDLDTYIHRAGRTARAGRTGICITLYTKQTEGLISRIENKVKIKFKKVGAPQRKEIIEASIRDIKTAVEHIDDSMISLFKSSASQLIDEFGAENAVSRLFAFVSGHTDKMRSRSLLVGAEGFITYKIKFNSTFSHAGYVWGFFKRILPENIKQKIRGLKMYKGLDGCVFDLPEEGHTDFEEIIFNDRMYGVNYTLEKAEELPELQESADGPSNYSSQNRFGNSNPGRQYKSGNRDRAGRKDVFVGNLPRDASETSMDDWLDKHRVNTKNLEIRLVKDRDTQEFKGFGFVSTYDKDSLEQILNLNGRTFNGRSLRINEADNKGNK